MHIYICIHISVKLNHFAVQHKLTQHYKSTILQFKNKKGNNYSQELVFVVFLDHWWRREGGVSG